MKRNKPMHLLALLATGVLLAACQAKEEAHPQPVTPSSSSVVVAQSSSSTKASSSKASSSKRLQAQAAGQDASQVAEGSEGAALPEQEEAGVATATEPEASVAVEQESAVTQEVQGQAETSGEEEAVAQPTQPVQEEPVAAPSYTTSFDARSLSGGDYSSIAGTWANSKGQVFTVSADGTLYFGETFDETGHHLIEGVGQGSTDRIGGSLGFYANGERAGGAHISIVPAGVANINGLVDAVDHIEIGHDISSGYPENQYYRQ